MRDFNTISTSELNQELVLLQKQYQEFKSQNLKLNMSRGKPCKEQLDISMGLFESIEYKSEDGTDCRNYGCLDGISEAKELFAELMEVSKNQIIIGGNSSLNMMYDTIARAMSFGVYGGSEPWGRQGKIKFICPSPGYDRHFAICELFKIEMIVVEMKNDGPDMDMVEKLVAEDESIKGIWCVPKYSNPDGITYSDKVVERFAKMNVKAKDFRIFWDNAYAVHHLSDSHDSLKNILDECIKAGNPDRVFMFGSTSKITFPGSGIAFMAASEENINYIKKQLSIQTIGPDKLNQLRHVSYFKTLDGILEHMKKHAAIIKPKFDAVLDILDRELGGKNIAWWNKPNGGYFISLNTLDGCAKKVVGMAKDVGVVLTNAGATFPYGKDPRDRNIRIAPTFPTLEELKKAIELVCICIKIASIEKMLDKK